MADQRQQEGTSLWNRSKRVIGGKNFTFLQHQPKQTEATSERQTKPAIESAKAAHARRREQVRRAQKTHRERKESYIKFLEQEVLRLREEEVTTVQAAKVAEEENVLLKEIMTRNGLNVPQRTSKPQSVATVSVLGKLQSVATVSVLGRPDGPYTLQVTLPETMDYSQTTSDYRPPPFTTPERKSYPETLQTAGQQLGHSSEEPSEQGSPPVQQPKPTAHSISLNTPQIGIDFVLSLERPCLHHTRGDLTRELPPGHALTAQAPLLTTAPRNLSPSSTWQIPTVEIDRLLELSSRFDLCGGVTPVQAWARIRNYPGFENLSRDGLEGLKQALMSEVQCLGFGAVVDESVLEELLEQCFYGL